MKSPDSLATPAGAAAALLTPEAVRERAHALLAHGLAGRLHHWRVDLDRLPAAADLVVEVTRAAYPSLDIPFHARWRHVGAGGVDRWGALVVGPHAPKPEQRLHAAFELAIVSVLLDAGAGMAWRYLEAATGREWSKSEGLAVASVDMFASGAFSDAPATDPLRVDADALVRLTAERLARGFQVSESNPLVGLEGRANLLNRLGATVAANPAMFRAADGAVRLGALADRMRERSGLAGLRARDILIVLLEALGSIWPGRESLGAANLGDCWRHPLATGAGETNGLVPFHKLSQWLSYSLIEPLEWAGVRVVEIDGLTGLPEYRNGGLFMDMGVIALKDAADAARAHEVGSLAIVEWRALTVALLDQIAPLVRERLGLTADAFPLAKVLEGGTWATGRRLARDKRADGGPPLVVVSDGTVF